MILKNGFLKIVYPLSSRINVPNQRILTQTFSFNLLFASGFRFSVDFMKNDQTWPNLKITDSVIFSTCNIII